MPRKRDSCSHRRQAPLAHPLPRLQTDPPAQRLAGWQLQNHDDDDGLAGARGLLGDGVDAQVRHAGQEDQERRAHQRGRRPAGPASQVRGRAAQAQAGAGAQVARRWRRRLAGVSAGGGKAASGGGQGSSYQRPRSSL